MNIVYLIENGFDVSNNLPTDYASFYDYYCHIHDCKNSMVAELRDTIYNDKNNWSDLELALGKYWNS